MATKKVDALEGEFKQLKISLDERFSSLEGLKDRLSNLEDMVKVLELNVPPAASTARAPEVGQGSREIPWASEGRVDPEIEILGGEHDLPPREYIPRRGGTYGYGYERFGEKDVERVEYFEGEQRGRRSEGEQWRDPNIRHLGEFDGGRGYRGDPRVRKLKMPVFEGDDAYGWIYRVERYFAVNGLTNEEKLTTTALCLEGKILTWYQWRDMREPMRSWGEFKHCLMERFRTSREGDFHK